jgi:hypothetical protein
MTHRVMYITFAILVLLLFAAYIVKFVYADEMGTGLGTGLGAGGGTVSGPVTPTGDTWQSEAMTWQGEGVLWQ